MANTYRNRSVRGTTGPFGEHPIAHTTYSGRIILTSQPLLNESRQYLEALKAHRAAMLEASTYASFARTQAIYLQKEQETGLSAYYLAVADWFSVPRVLQIDLDRWTGKARESIRIKARDSVSVARVALVIRDADGKILEMGEAVQLNAGSSWWRYTTRSEIPLRPFPTVQAIAQDLPGNSASFTVS